MNYVAQHYGIAIPPPQVLWQNGMPVVCTDTAPLTSDRRLNSTMADTNVCERITVYKVTCLVNGKHYIGITARSIEERWPEHVGMSRYSKANRPFLHAIRKYGAESFVVEAIFSALSRDAANEVEREFIAEYGSLHPGGYNLSTGGEGTVGRRLAAEAKANMSAAVKATWADPVMREKMIAGFQNRVIPESHKEHLRALAAAQKGKPRKPESIAKGRAKLMGHAVSEETRAKIAAKNMGRGWTEEQRERHIVALKQRHKDGVFTKHTATMGQRRKALMADPEYRAGYVHPMTGRHHTEEAKARIGALARERMTPEYREKMSAVQRGRPWSEKQRTAIMASKNAPGYSEKARQAALKGHRRKAEKNQLALNIGAVMEPSV